MSQRVYVIPNNPAGEHSHHARIVLPKGLLGETSESRVKSVLASIGDAPITQIAGVEGRLIQTFYGDPIAYLAGSKTAIYEAIGELSDKILVPERKVESTIFLDEPTAVFQRHLTQNGLGECSIQIYTILRAGLGVPVLDATNMAEDEVDPDPSDLSDRSSVPINFSIDGVVTNYFGASTDPTRFYRREEA